MLRNAVGGGGVSFPRKKRYEGVRYNVICVTRGWVGVKFPVKKCYVKLEWPLITMTISIAGEWHKYDGYRVVDGPECDDE